MSNEPLQLFYKSPIREIFLYISVSKVRLSGIRSFTTFVHISEFDKIGSLSEGRFNFNNDFTLYFTVRNKYMASIINDT